MKVYIGPYRDRWVSYVHDKYMNKKYGWDWTEYGQKGMIHKTEPMSEAFLRKLEDALQWIYNHTINLIIDRRSGQKTKIRIDKYDTWSMDHTLAPIILPMLKQLKETKHGSPIVDDEDVPEELRSTSASPKDNDYDIDEYHHKRWDWVLYEMIWAFEQKCRDHWEEDYYGPYIEGEDDKLLSGRFEWTDDEGRKKHQERMSNGFRLFGKYYENLWD
jgi:hypothetical protein